MSERVVILPGPAHPITIEANPARVVVRAGGRVVADSTLSLTLREASYPAVRYIPRTDVDIAGLMRSTHASYCPYKGEATYFCVARGDGRIADLAWSYETPFPAMAGIKDHLAFYPDRVDSIAEQPTDPGFRARLGGERVGRPTSEGRSKSNPPARWHARLSRPVDRAGGGDAIVTLNLLTGEHGPPSVPCRVVKGVGDINLPHSPRAGKANVYFGPAYEAAVWLPTLSP